MAAQTSAGQGKLSASRREIETEKAAIEVELTKMEREYTEERQRMEEEMERKVEEMSKWVAEKKGRLAVLNKADQYIASFSGAPITQQAGADVEKSPLPEPFTNGHADGKGLDNRESLVLRNPTSSHDG